MNLAEASLNRLPASLPRADPHAVLEGKHEDLPVAHFAVGTGAGTTNDRVHGRADVLIVDADGDLDAGHRPRPRRFPPYVLHLAMLAAVPFHRLDGQPVVVPFVQDRLQRLLHALQPFGADDRNDELHRSSEWKPRSPCIATSSPSRSSAGRTLSPTADWSTPPMTSVPTVAKATADMI